MNLEAAEKAVSLDGSNYRSHWALAAALRLPGNYEAAALRYERAFELNPHDPDMLADWGEFLRNTGRAEEAVTQLKRATALNPHYPDWYINILADSPDIPQMTYETAVIPRALKPHSTIWPGLVGTVRTDRLIGDRKRTPTTISHFEGMVRAAQYTCVASVDVNAPGARPVMAAKELAAARQSGARSQRTELLRRRPPPSGT